MIFHNFSRANPYISSAALITGRKSISFNWIKSTQGAHPVMKGQAELATIKETSFSASILR